MNLKKNICNRCVVDNTVVGVVFDSENVCNFCSEFLERNNSFIGQTKEDQELKFNGLISAIKEAGKNKKYDCVVGVSGGVDSSWVLINAVKNGLRPLAVHMDNGWNSELAQNNISNLLENLGVDLHTHVIDWSEYRSLMQAFFDADVVDVELLYDNAMLAVNYQSAKKFGVKYILSGNNIATEGMKMPNGWNHLKFDKRNIKGISKAKKGPKINSFPAIGTIDRFKFEYIYGIKWTDFLDYTSFNKDNALSELELNYGYKPYPYKHYESIFTRFYQGYILPNKFKIDKRKIHLSNLVITNQMSRDLALTKLEEIPYPSLRDLEEDMEYFIKKMNWSHEKLNEYISRSEIPHREFPSEVGLWNFAKKAHGLITKIF